MDWIVRPFRAVVFADEQGLPLDQEEDWDLGISDDCHRLGQRRDHGGAARRLAFLIMSRLYLLLSLQHLRC